MARRFSNVLRDNNHNLLQNLNLKKKTEHFEFKIVEELIIMKIISINAITWLAWIYSIIIKWQLKRHYQRFYRSRDRSKQKGGAYSKCERNSQKKRKITEHMQKHKPNDRINTHTRKINSRTQLNGNKFVDFSFLYMT